MQQPRTSILHRIGKVFQARTEDIAHEPLPERLPERWVDFPLPAWPLTDMPTVSSAPPAQRQIGSK
jgi:hypothetical protein